MSCVYLGPSSWNNIVCSVFASVVRTTDAFETDNGPHAVKTEKKTHVLDCLSQGGTRHHHNRHPSYSVRFGVCLFLLIKTIGVRCRWWTSVNLMNRKRFESWLAVLFNHPHVLQFATLSYPSIVLQFAATSYPSMVLQFAKPFRLPATRHATCQLLRNPDESGSEIKIHIKKRSGRSLCSIK